MTDLRVDTYEQLGENDMPFEPSGIAGTMEYNGLIFNDRRFLDRIEIQKITGLDDPDSRDSRQVNEDEDGETAFNSLYGGRQLAITGFVEAGNYFKMKKLWSDFKAAFDDQQDHWLNFFWLDWIERWEGKWQQDFEFLIGTSAGLTSPQPGTLVVGSTQAKTFAMTQREYTDAEFILPFEIGSSGETGTNAGAILKKIDSANYLVFAWVSGEISIYSMLANVKTRIATTSTPALLPGSQRWLRGYTEGDIGYIEMWDVFPYDGGTPISKTNVNLPSQLNGSVSGRSGITVTGGTTQSLILGEVRLESRQPGDTMIWCRKNAKIESEDAANQQGRYRKDFLLSLRSASPNYVSRKSRTVYAPVTNAIIYFPNDGNGIIFPIDGRGFRFGHPISDRVVNLGRSPAHVVMRFYGPCTNPGVYCYDTDTLMALQMSLADTTKWVEIDTEKKTVIDQSGNNVYSNLQETSGWLKIGPGENDIIYGADSFTSGVTKIQFTYRHTSR